MLHSGEGYIKSSPQVALCMFLKNVSQCFKSQQQLKLMGIALQSNFYIHFMLKVGFLEN